MVFPAWAYVSFLRITWIASSVETWSVQRYPSSARSMPANRFSPEPMRMGRNASYARTASVRGPSWFPSGSLQRAWTSKKGHTGRKRSPSLNVIYLGVYEVTSPFSRPPAPAPVQSTFFRCPAAGCHAGPTRNTRGACPSRPAAQMRVADKTRSVQLPSSLPMDSASLDCALLIHDAAIAHGQRVIRCLALATNRLAH